MSASAGSLNPPRVDMPVPHLSAGRQLVPQRYMVGWPCGIVKVGSTDYGRRRWGAFLSRGAAMLDLAFYPKLIDALHAESWLQEQLSDIYAPAFRNTEDARPFLGGGGYLECFRVAPSDFSYVTKLAKGGA